MNLGLVETIDQLKELIHRRSRGRSFKLRHDDNDEGGGCVPSGMKPLVDKEKRMDRRQQLREL